MRQEAAVFFHFVTPEYYPERGGLQQSLQRIATSLVDAFPNSQHAIYVLETKAKDYGNVHFVKNFMKKLSRPLSSSSFTDSVKSYKQLRFLSLESQIKEMLNSYPDHEHLIISFYASHTGFYSQMVASRFNIKHISSIRGSDFFVNFLNHTSFSSLEFVVGHANHIITTNNMQRDMLLSLYSQTMTGRITTIHNALKGSVPPYINKHAIEKGRHIQLFTDSGFSYKKGTDHIIDAFMRLFKDGEKIELSIAGDIKEEEKDYWDTRIQSVKESCGESFRQLGYQDSVLPFMQQADIFISASLSEGCSNSRILALCMGIPIITTDNGAIIDYPFPKTNVVYVPVGNPVMIARCIRGIIRNLSSGQGEISSMEREERLRYFSPEREKKEWVLIINKVLKR